MTAKAAKAAESVTEDTSSEYLQEKSYEEFLELVSLALFSASQSHGSVQHITLDRNKEIEDAKGKTQTFDLYWEYQMGDEMKKTVIMCHNGFEAAPTKEVKAFITKLKNIDDVTGVVVSRSGFAKGVAKPAAAKKIRLIDFGEVSHENWDERTNDARINLNYMPTARLLTMKPVFNEAWKEGNITLFTDANLTGTRESGQIVMEDKADEEDAFKMSISDLKDNDFRRSSPGQHEWNKEFKDGWLHLGEDVSLKIDSMRIEYMVSESVQIPTGIDVSQYAAAFAVYFD